MGDPQGCWVGVDPVSDHAVVHGPSCWDLIAGQQTHDTGLPMVELTERERENKRSCSETTPPPGGGLASNPTLEDCRRQEVVGGLTEGMALKRWVMKEAPCWTAFSAWDRLATE